MCSSIFITITALHLAYPYVASNKFSVTEPDQEAEFFSQFIEATTLWNEIKTKCITKFSEGRYRFRHQLEVQHCWPDDMNGISNAQQNAERATHKRQKKQRYIYYNLRGLKPKYLQLKAQEQLMEYPNATWNEFSSHNNQEEVMIQVFSKFLHDVEQIKTELATKGQEMRNLRIELQEHRVIALEGISRARTPTKKGKHKTVRFWNYCHKIGNTRNCCRKKMPDEEIRKARYEISSTRNHVPTQDHGTNALDRSAQYDHNMDLSLDSDDGNTPTKEVQPTKEEAGQDEPNKFTPSNQDFFTWTIAWASERHNST